MEELQEKQPTISNHNENCQVFNGPVSGCIFAMPGSNVTQSPMQHVDSKGTTDNSKEEANAVDNRLLIPIPDGLAPEIVAAPEKTIKGAKNPFVIRTIQDAGSECKTPWHYACLMSVCDDHGQLIDRTAITDFARTMVAWGIVKLKDDRTVTTLANSIRHTMPNLTPRYKEWGSDLQKYKDKCESLASYFDESMPYKYKNNPK